MADVHPATGTGDALHLGDSRGIVRTVLQVNAQDLAALFFRRLEISDVAFFFQNARDLLLQARSGNIELLVTRVNRIADARQQICDRIGQTHLLSSPLIVTRLPRTRRGTCRDVLQNQPLALSHWPLALAWKTRSAYLPWEISFRHH